MRLGLGLGLVARRKWGPPGGGGGDVTAPTLSSAVVTTIAPNQIVLTYNETLNASSTPATGAFTVTGKTVSGVVVSGSTVTITVSAAFIFGDTITISYTAGASPIEDTAGNNAANLSNQAVTNNVEEEPGEIATTFNSLYAGDWVLDSGTDAKTQPALTFPAKTTNIMTGGYREPVYDTEMRIITAAADVGTTGNDVAVHDYSNQQAFNADSTRFNIQSRNGFHYIMDSSTNAKLDMGGVNSQGPGAVPGMAGNCEPGWHPTDPDIITYTANGGSMIRTAFNIVTKTNSTLFNLTSLIQAEPGMATAGKAWSFGEGRCSDDGDRWGFVVTTAADACLGMVVYQLSTNTILRSWTFSNLPNWASISPSGQYILSSWYGTSAGSVYPASIDAETARPLNSKGGCNVFKVSDGTHEAISMLGEHSDIAWDWEGKEVYMSVSFSPGDGFVYDGCVYTRRLEDPTFQTEYPIRSSGGSTGAQFHFSGRAIKRKGWGLVNKSPGVGSGAWDGAVMAIELVPNAMSPKIYRLFQHRAAGGDQFASPCATVNNDFTRVLAHTQDASGNDVDLCCVLPSWALPVAGTSIPVNTTAPTITGTPTQGEVLTRTLGTWAGVPTPTVTGKWQRSTNSGSTWSDVGSTASTYTVPGGETNGNQLAWQDTATNVNGSSSLRSNVFTILAMAAPVNTVAPSVPGSGTTADPVTATSGTWTGNPPPTYVYTWQRDISSVWTDSAFTTASATLSPAGSWRIKVVATNSQGSATAYSSTCTVSAAPSEPVPSNIITFNQANNTTLETINSAWEGTTRYQVQSSTLQNIDPFGAGSDLAWLTAASGTDQAVQATMKQPTDMAGAPDRYLKLYLQASGTQNGYVCEITETQIRLFRQADGSPVAGPENHGVDVSTTDLTCKMTKLAGRIRIYINGSSTALIDYTDTSPVTGGYAGLAMYPGATSTRIKVSEFRYS